MERAIVIGAFSFLGFHLTKKLLEEGITVYGLDLEVGFDELKEEKILAIGRNSNLHYVGQKDCENWTKNITEKKDVLFFTIDLEDDSALVEQYLHDAIRYCELHSMKLIFSSSTETVAHDETIINEQSPIAPLTKRGELYLNLEKMIQAQGMKQNLSYLILRLPTLYGPWQPETFAFQQVLRLMEEGKEVGWVDDEYIGDALYVEDAIDAMKKAAVSTSTQEVIHITSGNSGDWVKGMNTILTKNSIERQINYRLSNEKAQELLSFSPCVTIEEGLCKQRSHIRISLGKEM